MQKHRWSLTGALLGALVFLVLYGVRVLDPVCVDWILNNPSPDPSQHYLGWVFYRRSGWHLPYLGTNYSAIYPYRTSILYTDSIPLLAVVCKLLGGVLPARFQYLGLWGLFCYAMQGGLAQALIARIGGVRPQDTAKNRASVLGAGVLVLFPALNIRMFAHTALAANWLVLLALWVWLCAEQSENRPSTGKLCLWWGVLGLLCAGIHLYYLPMVGMVLVATCVQRGLEKCGPAAVVLPIVSFCAVALAELFVLGAFAANFAGYSNGYLSGADLANLFVPGLGASWEQEVYAGLGTTAAVVLALAGLLVQRKKAVEFFRRHTHIVVAAVVLLVLDAALTGGMEYPALSDQLDQALSGTELTGLSEQELADRVAGKLAEELLAAKFLQGIPLAGAVGGVLDSRLTARLLDYAALKYNRRFLLDHRPSGAAGL